MRSLILEGVDCGGKSTLATQLVQRHAYKYVHCVPAFDTSPQQVFSFYAGHLHNAAQRYLFEPESATLLDRCYLSETIYGPLKRGVNRLAGKVALLDNLREEYGIRQVICMPPWEYVLEAWRAKKEDYIKTEDELRRVYEAYQMYAYAKGVETYNYVTDGMFVA